jgi:hypothetical protein
VSDETLQRLRAICAEVGFDLGSATAGLWARLALLADCGQTVSDCERMVGMAREVFARRAGSADAFTDGERRIVVLGCVLSDIGKTGPARADLDGQRLIAEMFAVEGVRDDTQSVARFFDTYFPNDADERRRRFTALGLELELSMRKFWNLHSGWTLEILESSNVPPEAIAGAATHHLLDDVNPGAIVQADEHFIHPFGDNVAFDRAEKLIILLDKYDALRRRGRRRHAEAIAWLRDRVRSSARFHDDPQFSSLIADLDVTIEST